MHRPNFKELKFHFSKKSSISSQTALEPTRKAPRQMPPSWVQMATAWLPIRQAEHRAPAEFNISEHKERARR